MSYPPSDRTCATAEAVLEAEPDEKDGSGWGSWNTGEWVAGTGVDLVEAGPEDEAEDVNGWED